MELYTMDRGFKRQQTVDKFFSVIWTERYYGDGDFELNLIPDAFAESYLPVGQFIGLPESPEPMIIETRNVENNVLKVTGISLTKWLNNRILRSSPDPAATSWLVTGIKPGVLITTMVQNWAIDSAYLTDYSGTPPANSMGLTPNPSVFKIPGLSITGSDSGGSNIDATVPFGPLYDAIREIAVAYNIGMRTTLDSVSDTSYSLGFKSYRGVDRTSDQFAVDVVRFSPDQDSLNNVKELESLETYASIAFAVASGVDAANAYSYGPVMSDWASRGSGFDLRAAVVSSNLSQQQLDDYTGDDAALYRATLGNDVNAYLGEHKHMRINDGEIIENVNRYLWNYGLGDIIELEALDGNLQKARVTEYIRSQDAAGVKNYPTVELIA
jgi:Siphovirus ReqiPepy6 Gp37-like protein